MAHVQTQYDVTVGVAPGTGRLAVNIHEMPWVAAEKQPELMQEFNTWLTHMYLLKDEFGQTYLYRPTTKKRIGIRDHQGNELYEEIPDPSAPAMIQGGRSVQRKEDTKLYPPEAELLLPMKPGHTSFPLALKLLLIDLLIDWDRNGLLHPGPQEGKAPPAGLVPLVEQSVF